MKSNMLFIERAATLLALPVAEYLCMRLFVRHFLGIQLGFAFGTDYNLVFPGLLAGICYLAFLHSRDALNPRLRLRTLRANLFGLALFLVATTLLRFKIGYGQSHVLLSFWFSAAALVLGSSAFVFLQPSDLFRRQYTLAILGAACVAACDSLVLIYLAPVAQPLARATAVAAFQLLQPFMHGLELGQNNEYILLLHPRYSIAVGTGCSGLEGMVLLLTMFCFYAAFWKSSSTRARTLLFALASLAYMFLVNVARVATFFSAAVFATGRWGSMAGLHTSLTLFHNLVGWIVYSVAFAFFFRIFGVPDRALARRAFVVQSQIPI